MLLHTKIQFFTAHFGIFVQKDTNYTVNVDVDADKKIQLTLPVWYNCTKR
jgi:hypothetical protein